jgi:branched-chain amino acid transport system ATP-binding protein
MNSTVATSKLEVRYGQVVALRGIDLEARASCLTTVIGPNGAGKTTLLRTICGLEIPSAGRVTINGSIVEKPTPERMLEHGVALVPEGRHVFPHLSVRDNLLLGAFRWRRAKKVVDDTMADVYRWFPKLEGFAGRSAGTLSGGEQQMLAIGRALMSRPDVLCLDEPSLGLAPIVVRELLSLLQRLCGDGVTVILVEQFAYLALQAADDAYLLENGSIVRSGAASDLIADDHVKSSYLGVKPAAPAARTRRRAARAG